MPLPNVLIIGAMKAGTTSLYMDLASHPQVFLAEDKEPHSLCHAEVLTPAGRAAYEAIYAKARADQLCCDASTGYAKRPDYEGVAARAVQVLPAGFKVVYVVRDPIERIISQHHHEFAEGRVGRSIDEEVRRHPRYVQYSRYYYQLKPWIEAVGRERVHVVRFEDYVHRREETVRRLCEFLGLPSDGCAVDEQRVYNKSQGKPVKTPFWHAMQHNSFYRRFLRPLAPLKLRQVVRQALFPKAPDRPDPPTAATLSYLREALSDDVRQLSEWLVVGRPLWDGYDGDVMSAPPAHSKA